MSTKDQTTFKKPIYLYWILLIKTGIESFQSLILPNGKVLALFKQQSKAYYWTYIIVQTIDNKKPIP